MQSAAREIEPPPTATAHLLHRHSGVDQISLDSSMGDQSPDLASPRRASKNAIPHPPLVPLSLEDMEKFEEQFEDLRDVTCERGPSGFGITLTGGGPVVIESLTADSTLQQAGVRAGDVILAINGNKADTLTHRHVVHLLKKSTILTVLIARRKTGAETGWKPQMTAPMPSMLPARRAAPLVHPPRGNPPSQRVPSKDSSSASLSSLISSAGGPDASPPKSRAKLSPTGPAPSLAFTAPTSSLAARVHFPPPQPTLSSNPPAPATTSGLEAGAVSANASFAVSRSAPELLVTPVPARTPQTGRPRSRSSPATPVSTLPTMPYRAPRLFFDPLQRRSRVSMALSETSLAEALAREKSTFPLHLSFNNSFLSTSLRPGSGVASTAGSMPVTPTRTPMVLRHAVSLEALPDSEYDLHPLLGTLELLPSVARVAISPLPPGPPCCTSFRGQLSALRTFRVAAAPASSKSLCNELARQLTALGTVSHSALAPFLAAAIATTPGQLDLTLAFIAPVSGMILFDALRRRSSTLLPTTGREALQSVVGLCGAIAYLHDEHMQHGAVSPHTVVVGADRVLRLCFYGVPSLVAHAAFTPDIEVARYRAPECLTSSVAATRAADIYGLGLLLFELVSGRVPFAEAKTVDDLVDLVLHRQARPAISSNLPRGLVPVLTLAWGREPQRRPQASFFATVLSNILDDWQSGSDSDSDTAPTTHAPAHTHANTPATRSAHTLSRLPATAHAVSHSARVSQSAAGAPPPRRGATATAARPPLLPHSFPSQLPARSSITQPSATADTTLIDSPMATPRASTDTFYSARSSLVPPTLPAPAPAAVSESTVAYPSSPPMSRASLARTAASMSYTHTALSSPGRFSLPAQPAAGRQSVSSTTAAAAATTVTLDASHALSDVTDQPGESGREGAHSPSSPRGIVAVTTPFPSPSVPTDLSSAPVRAGTPPPAAPALAPALAPAPAASLLPPAFNFAPSMYPPFPSSPSSHVLWLPPGATTG
eukprot:m.92012 g.92012  ORF g.92012 m.92012 type:complete len:999 (-) comp13758_c1_seq1:35-3031(-)